MRAFFDIDTQIDFVFPAGALYTRGAEKVIPSVALLNRYAAANGITLISTMCAHGEEASEFSIWGPHCVKGTAGQAKPAATLLPPGSNQIFIEKDELDLFTNPAVDKILDEQQIHDCVVYGVLTEYCVKFAVEGLLARGRKVSLVQDAIAHFSETQGAELVRAFESQGVRLISAAQAMA